MASLIYNPGVKIIISTGANLFDVSEDIENGSLTLNENNPHSLSFTLSNANSKYSGVFTPNDRVIVMLKRLSWLQVFSGYLDIVPYFSAYPKSASFQATCTLKRLKYFGWDPGWAPVINKLQGLVSTDQSVAPSDTIPGVVIGVLTDVIGWEVSKIHFGALPQDWITTIAPLWKDVQADVQASLQKIGTGSSTGASSSSAGTGLSASGGMTPGAPWTAAAWAYYILGLIGAPQTPNNITNFQCWMAAENNPATWYEDMSNGVVHSINNPLNNGLGSGGGGGTGGYPDLVTSAKFAATEIMGGTGSGLNSTIFDSLKTDPTLANFTLACQASNWSESHYPNGLGSPSALTANEAPAACGTQPGTPPTSSNSLTTGTNTGANNPNSPAPHNPTITGNTAGTGSNAIAQAPNAAAATAYAMSKVGDSYTQNSPGREGPNSFDCSGLVFEAWLAAGQSIGENTYTQYANPNIVLVDISQLTPGDLLFANFAGETAPGHVAMYVGNDTVVQAANTTLGVISGSLENFMSSFNDPSVGYFMGVGRVTTTGQGGNKSGQAVNVTAAQIAAAGGNGNTATGLGAASGGKLTYGTGGWDPAGAATDPTSGLYTGLKVLEQDTPIMPMITALIQTSLRHYCSAPNGDFIAWWPDYFGQYGVLASWHLSTVELIDFNIDWSDQNLITHQYVAGNFATVNQSLDPTGSSLPLSTSDQINSFGIATIDMPTILYALFNIDPKSNSVFATADTIYEQFGARVDFQYMPTVAYGVAEFWFALNLFQQNWSKQFAANIELTFMPELFPGMLLAIDDLNMQVYVNAVTHNWNLGEGGGFTTTVQIQSPSSMTAGPHGGGSGLIGLARGG